MGGRCRCQMGFWVLKCIHSVDVDGVVGLMWCPDRIQYHHYDPFDWNARPLMVLYRSVFVSVSICCHTNWYQWLYYRSAPFPRWNIMIIITPPPGPILADHVVRIVRD